MPWLETAPVEERIRFIQDTLSDRFTMAELCALDGSHSRLLLDYKGDVVVRGIDPVPLLPQPIDVTSSAAVRPRCT